MSKRVSRSRNSDIVALAQFDPEDTLSVLLANTWNGVLTYLSLPSKLTQELDLASLGTAIRSTIESGSTIGRNDREWGEMAVSSITGFSG